MEVGGGKEGEREMEGEGGRRRGCGEAERKSYNRRIL